MNKIDLVVDAVVIRDGHILLVKRRKEPFLGTWVLPGGHVEYGEKTEDAILRELKEESGVDGKVMTLIGVYSDPGRDPRGHAVSVVYLMKYVDGEIKPGDDAEEVSWFDLSELPEMGFDHGKIVEDVRDQLAEIGAKI